PVRLPPGPIEAGYKSKLHGVSGDGEHDWDAGGRSLSRKSRSRPGCDNHSHLKLDQISDQHWKPIRLVSRPAIFDHEVPAFNVPGLAQTSSRASESGRIGLGRSEV